LATVKWDDEGVEPDEFMLVDQGVLVDYQTTREQAPWLAPWYQKQGKPVRSHGCAGADSALSITMQHAPNLVLGPGSDHVTFDDLVSDTKKGLAVLGAETKTDFQQRNGVVRGVVREIVNGKLGDMVGGLVALFNTTELLKNLLAIGGADSAAQFAASDLKGQPTQGTSHSVRAVPAKFANVSFIDPRRKA
jgi:TldD protein